MTVVYNFVLLEEIKFMIMIMIMINKMSKDRHNGPGPVCTILQKIYPIATLISIFIINLNKCLPKKEMYNG